MILLVNMSLGGYDEFTVPVAQFDAYPRVVQAASPAHFPGRFPAVRTCVWVGVAALLVLVVLFYFYTMRAPRGAATRPAGRGAVVDPYFTNWDALSRKSPHT